MIIKPDTIVSDRYTIIEKIGVGGMAVVYKAKDEKLNRLVTFKVLKEEHISDDEFIKRFEIEAQAAARLSHSNIVNVYDVGKDGDIYYIVMEYIDGVTLKDLINRRAPFDDQEALGVAIQIASALEEAHKNGIVHRDIKPQNILVTKEGIIKVTDFGIARASTSTTVTVESMGSVHYFSPEQARGGFVDAKSDIYSLGIVLFEMVTGDLPFHGDTPVALAMKHLREPIPDIYAINPNVSESVELIILKATQKISSKRYQTIEDMNSDLKRATKNPSGDFVTFDEDSVTSETITFSNNEINEIRNQSKSDYDDYDDYDDEKNKPKPRQPIKPMPVNFPSSQSSYKPKNDEYEYDKKSEIKVIIGAIFAAIVVIALVTVCLVKFLNVDGDDIEVPKFVGKTWSEACDIAEQNKIYIGKDPKKGEEYSDEYDKGVIISQNLQPGDIVKETNTIYVVVSLGSSKVKVPDVSGKSIDDAVKLISDAGLTPVEEYEFNDDVKKTYIIKQEPKNGEMVSRDSKVTIYISRGEESESIIVPNVVGKSEYEARKILNAEGLYPQVSYSSSSYVEKDYVISQSILSGEEVEEGATITIRISTGNPAQQTTPKKNNNNNNNSNNSSNNDSDNDDKDDDTHASTERNLSEQGENDKNDKNDKNDEDDNNKNDDNTLIEKNNENNANSNEDDNNSNSDKKDDSKNENINSSDNSENSNGSNPNSGNSQNSGNSEHIISVSDGEENIPTVEDSAVN